MRLARSHQRTERTHEHEHKSKRARIQSCACRSTMPKPASHRQRQIHVAPRSRSIDQSFGPPAARALSSATAHTIERSDDGRRLSSLLFPFPNSRSPLCILLQTHAHRAAKAAAMAGGGIAADLPPWEVVLKLVLLQTGLTLLVRLMLKGKAVALGSTSFIG